MRYVMFLVALSLWAQSDDLIAHHASAAAVALKSGNYAAAERENREILRLQPKMAEAEMNLGISCFLQRKYDQAIQAFEAGLKLKPDMNRARLFLGISRFDLNQTAAALSPLERYATEQPDDLQGQYFLGLTFLELKHYSDAERALLAARNIDPRNVDILYHLAQAYVGEARERPARQEELARSFADTYGEMAAIDPTSYRIAQLRAAFYESKGEKAKAEEELEKLFLKDPRVRGLHYTLGCLYLEDVQYSRALTQFEAELQLDDPEPRTFLQLGHVLIALTRPEKALSVLNQAVARDPGDAGSAWVDMGRAYRQMEQPEKAVMAFQKGIQLGEKKANVYYQLSLAARRAGNLAQAREALEASERLRSEENHPPTNRN